MRETVTEVTVSFFQRFNHLIGMAAESTATPPAPPYLPPRGEPIVVFMDEHLIVLDKPSGLLSVPGRGLERADCLASRVHVRFADARIVHRLDMATSGLIVMARGAHMERALSIAFQQRQVEKCYEALVAGRPAQVEGDIHLPLITDWPRRPRQKVDPDTGKPSHTHFRVLSYDPGADVSRVALIPHTGRSHQLRVHLQAIGHPILGDELYAPDAAFQAAPRLMLHACRLCFAHPALGYRLELNSPPPF